MDTCFSCKVSLTDDKVFLTCAECKSCYHIGTCSGVAENAYKKMSQATKKAWKCPTCKATKARCSSLTSDNTEATVDLAQEIAEIRRMLAEVLTIKEKLETLETIKITVDDIEKSVELMSTKYDEVIARMEKQSADISDLGKRVEKLETKLKEGEIKQLKREVNNLEQYSRRQNLEIHGLQKHNNENLLEKLNLLANDLDLPPLSESDVEAIHRLPTRKDENNVDKVAPVLVRFASRVVRDKWLAKKKELRDADSKIFLNENLTTHNKKLLWLMKTKATEKEYKFAWVKNGKLFVRRNARDKIINITTIEDLELIR
ncbi:uncharacterized protein LOC144112558 [Amblyomma americanum]